MRTTCRRRIMSRAFTNASYLKILVKIIEAGFERGNFTARQAGLQHDEWILLPSMRDAGFLELKMGHRMSHGYHPSEWEITDKGRRTVKGQAEPRKRVPKA
jgi:hypothetical protein